MEDENMEVWKEKVQQDISDVKRRQGENESKLNTVINDVHRLQVSDQLQDEKIESMRKALDNIQSDTQWIRRKITGAIITATITAVVAGVIGIAISRVF
jgi:hypothetical protein